METIKREFNMSRLIYGTITISLVLWIIGFFFFNIGAIVHLLILIATIAAIIKILKG